MSSSVKDSRELFVQIIRHWGLRPDPSEPFTFKQMANLVLGLGSDQNASIIGRTVFDFREYFYQQDGDTYRWHVRWKKIEQDHPDLFPCTRENRPTIPCGGPLADMQQALDDEIRAVRKQIREHPIKAMVLRGLGQMPDGGFWYEARLDLPGEAELAVPEGIEVQLSWARKLNVYPCSAKLLSYEPLKSAIIFETAQPLGETHTTNQFFVTPKIEDLIHAVVQQLERVKRHGERVVWQLLEKRHKRRDLSWTGRVVSAQLDSAQLEALQSCLRHDLTFLWGPPGTGKTHTLGRLMASAALSGRRILAAAISNVAVDQMALQLISALVAAGEDGKALLDEGRIIRFGHPREPAVTAESRLFPNKIQVQELRRELHDAQIQIKKLRESEAETRARLQRKILDLKSSINSLTKMLIDASRIVLTTAVQTCMEPAISESVFDFVVIDEASMMPIPYLTCVGGLGRDQLVVTGDFRQLGPIALSQTAAAFRWLHKNAFELAGIDGETPRHPCLATLRVQRRMKEEICSLINKPFYSGMLETRPQPGTKLSLVPLPDEPAVFIAFLAEDGSVIEQTLDGSRINRNSAVLVSNLICEYLKAASDLTVGVIAPYRAQVTYIKRLLRSRTLPEDQITRLRIGTVHAFQGSEADVMIWDLVETRKHKIGRLYQQDPGDRLTNVAISRAKRKLVIVGDPDAFFLAPGQESVGKLRSVIAVNFHSNSPKVISVRDLNIDRVAHAC